MTGFASVRQEMQQDAQRPQYHFLPPQNWMNDPNGIIHWHGTYHVFYQHNPDAPNWGNIHWGHAVSRDLVYWEDTSLALSPTAGAPDENGVWSGCAVDNNGVPTIIYTGVQGADHRQQTVCLAVSDHPNLVTWQKDQANPVLAAPPAKYKDSGFRDPYVWRSGSMWYMVIGAGKRDGAEVVLMYRSSDLCDWEFMYPLYESNRQNDYIFECPNFFQLGDKWVLLVSVMEESHVEYIIGDFTGYDFVPEAHQRLSYGVLYASLAFLDETERRLMMSWIRERRDDASQRAAGWSGVQSLPVALSLHEDNHLSISPAPELRTLRGEHHHAADVACEDDQWSVTGNQLELILQTESLAADFTLHIQGAESSVMLQYDAESRSIHTPHDQIALMDYYAQPDVMQAIHLQLFIDHSVIECIINQRIILAERLYESDPFDITLSGDAMMTTIDVWELASIWSA